MGRSGYLYEQRNNRLRQKTNRSFGLNTPVRLKILFSHPSAIVAKILGSMRGFSLMTPSHKDIPSLIDCLLNNVKGIPTSCCTTAH